MPQVPYTGVPDVVPQASGSRELTVRTNSNAFGDIVGQATQHLGRALEGAGDELFRRAIALQDLRNETEAREADAKYMEQTGKLEAEYNSLEGKAQVEALPGHITKLKELREQIRGGLSSDISRKMYDASSLGFMGRNIFNAAGHAAQANKVYQHQTEQAQIDQLNDHILHHPEDNEARIDALQLAHSVIQNRAARERWDDAKLDVEMKKEESKVTMAWILGINAKDPIKAQHALNANEDKLFGPDLDHVREKVRSETLDSGSRYIAHEVNGENYERKDVPIDDRIAEAKHLAERIRPGDVKFMDEAVRRTREQFTIIKQIKKDQEDRNMSVVEGALYSDRAPMTVDDLKADPDPKVAQTWDLLNPRQQEKIRRGLQANSKTEQRERLMYDNSEEGLRRYMEIKGLALNDLPSFLDIDLTKEKFSTDRRRKFFDLQQKLRAKPETDPRVHRAFNWLRESRGAELEALGVFSRNKDSPDDFDHFQGALQDAIDVWAEQIGKPPTRKEIIEQIGPDLIRQNTKTEPGSVFGWYWPNTSLETIWNAKIPQEDVDRFKEEVKYQTGNEPTDEQVRKAIVRQRLMKLYKKPAPDKPKPAVEE